MTVSPSVPSMCSPKSRVSRGPPAACCPFSSGARISQFAEIGRRLNVADILEGSVRTARNRIRVTAQLIKVADGFHLWSERYDRDMSDIFAI